MRELLERAAKNAGYKTFYWGDGTLMIMSEPYDATFNPADDDADAFRLMVDCELNATQLNHCAIVIGPAGTVQEFYVDHNNDKLAATRMAILRAAAGEA